MKRSLGQFYRLLRPVADPIRSWKNLCAYPRFIADLIRYRRLSARGPNVDWTLRPMLEERTAISAFDAHYTYLGAWAMRHIVRQRPKTHVDVGGQIGWVACVAAVTPCVFIDIRPLRAEVPGLRSVAGSVLNMPFPDRSLESLSCLHVAEHIGLGRYGDPLDPEGTIAAIRELSRVLAPRGTLYFGTPVGRPQVVFNAHRVSSPLEIAHRFAAEGLTLQSFAWADDYDRFHESGSPADAVGSEYACGMYCFTRS